MVHIIRGIAAGAGYHGNEYAAMRLHNADGTITVRLNGSLRSRLWRLGRGAVVAAGGLVTLWTLLRWLRARHG